MDKEFVLKKNNYSAEEVADIILEVIYKCQEEKLCRKFNHIMVDYGIRGVRFKMFY